MSTSETPTQQQPSSDTPQPAPTNVILSLTNTFLGIVVNIVALIIAIVALYYGWMSGMAYGPKFISFFQWIGSFLRGLVMSSSTSPRVSTAVVPTPTLRR